jgi:hypothetical protein
VRLAAARETGASDRIARISTSSVYGNQTSSSRSSGTSPASPTSMRTVVGGPCTTLPTGCSNEKT